jgi:hypothetical protein
MKKSMMVALSLLAVALSGCTESTPASETKEENNARFGKKHLEDIEPYNEIIILTDSKTGCEYILHGGSKYDSGMSALLDEFGKPSGCFRVDE